MATVLGTVTRTSDPKPYLARYRDGTIAGTFEGLRQAQEAVELSAGGVGTLQWSVEASMAVAGIESYRGERP